MTQRGLLPDDYGAEFYHPWLTVVDDYGDVCITCRYTHRLRALSDMRNMGAHVPGVKTECWCSVPDGVAAWKQSARWFAENDANCNTCAHLQRVPHAKCFTGMLDGICRKTSQALRFHPEDWMGMACYESRWSNAA